MRPKQAQPETVTAAAASELALLGRIRELIAAARLSVVRGVDLVHVHTSFQIGRHMVEHEQRGQARAGYGKALLGTLAERLSAEFGSGFSRSNLAYMRSFYLAYQDRAPIVQTLSGLSMATLVAPARAPRIQTLSGQSQRPFGLSWSHYVFLLGIRNANERSFYEIEATHQGWTLRELKRQFDSGLYERLALSRDKEALDAARAEVLATIRGLV